MQIIRPKHDFPVGTLPYFYLVGPVLGAGDWQHTMCRALEQVVDDCIIATPTRWNDSHPLASRFVGTMGTYESQTHWEQAYIERALIGPMSCVVSYLAAEDPRNPRTDGKPFGIDTYGEMNYFRGRLEGSGPHSRSQFRLALGVHPNYPYWKTLKKNLDYSYGGAFPYSESISRLAEEAKRMVEKETR